MEEPAFEELDQAAVAGAEGTAWIMPEFAACPPLPSISCYSTFTTDSPFDSFATDVVSTHVSAPIAIPVKHEPVCLDLNPVPSSPPQPSLCSVESAESYARHPSAPGLHSLVSSVKEEKSLDMPTSPISVAAPIAKSTRSLRPVSSRRATAKRAAPVSDFSKDDLADLKGTTAARSRKMTDEERKVMLHKRRLRNRASAARSREKRSRTLTDLTTEVEDLMKRAATLAHQANLAVEEARKLKAKNVMLLKENELLKSELRI